MNLNLTDRWCRLPAVGRVTSWCAALLLALVAAYIPYRGEPARTTGADFTPQWRRLLILSQQSEAIVLPETIPFSALDLQASGATLVCWLPDKKGGELVLESNWRSIPPLFALLARSGAAIPTFSIAPREEALAIVLRLEIDNDG